MLIQALIHSLSTKPLAASNVLLNWSQVRFRKFVEFRKYDQPKTHNHKLLLAACEPVMPIDRRPNSEKCYNLSPLPPLPEHPYDVLLAKDLVQELETYPLICLFHQNQMSTPQQRLAKNEYQHEGMYLRYYNDSIARLAMRGTKYEPLLHFAINYFFTVLLAPDTSKITQIIRIAKKYPDILLMGALVDQRRLLKAKQLEEFAKMSNLDMQRAILCSTLNTAQQGLLQTLNYHSSELSRMLKTHANPTTTTESTPTGEESPKQD